jgi:hypothetical protein
MNSIDALTIEEFGRRLRARDLTAEQVTDACLRRIEEDNPRLNAFILVMADLARHQARDADRELGAIAARSTVSRSPSKISSMSPARRPRRRPACGKDTSPGTTRP